MTTTRSITGATDKQIRFILRLLADKGFSTRYMDAQFSKLGAGMRERSGTVEGWLGSMNVARASALIDHLKSL